MQRYLLRSCVIPNMSAALIKKAYYVQAGGMSTSYSVCADWDFWCHIAMLCDFHYCTKPLNNFRTHTTSIRSTFSLQHQLFEIMGLLYAAAERIPIDESERYRFNMGIANIWAGQFTSNPLVWLRSFPAVWYKSYKYSKVTGVYLWIIICQKLAQKLFKLDGRNAGDE